MVCQGPERQSTLITDSVSTEYGQGRHSMGGGDRTAAGQKHPRAQLTPRWVVVPGVLTQGHEGRPYTTGTLSQVLL